MEHPKEVGTKVYINGPDHMTKMAAMAINIKKISFSRIIEKGLLATSLLSTSVPSTFLYLCPVRYKSYRYFFKKLF